MDRTWTVVLGSKARIVRWHGVCYRAFVLVPHLIWVVDQSVG